MNESSREILTAALKKMFSIFAVAVICILGAFAGGVIPFLILLPVVALFFGNDPAVGMMASILAIPLFYIGAPVGFVIALKWSWEHLVTKPTMESR